jgi:anti-sigma factor RsiW
MTTCRELIDFLVDFLDGTLPADQRVVFEEHLGRCPACVAYLREYQATVRLEQSTGRPGDDGSASDTIPEGLVRAILAARKSADG